LWTASVFVVALTVATVLMLVGRLFPKPPIVTAASFPNAAAPPNDLVWRMVAGATLVLLLTHFSSRLGPRLSGLFAMFPIMLSVLVVFSHRHAGPGFAINLLRGAVLGYYGFATFCIVLSLTLTTIGIGSAFALSLSCAVLVHLISRIYVLRAQHAVVHELAISTPPKR
jgi:hypothetical protein